jgi:LmbE family N-acetylglucosaminyl deacetylase
MRILVLAAHTDDAEFGCGGSIARFIEEGHQVHVVAFTYCALDILKEEFFRSCSKMGVEGKLLGFEARNFARDRQGILDTMIRERDRIAPDLVLLHNTEDIHQDHGVIAQEGIRAFKGTTVLGYELPWNSLSFRSTAFIKLQERHVTKKVDAVGCYASQSHRNYSDPEAVRAQCLMRGTAIGTRFAECFEAIRYVI